jgi:hypothetical protein
MTARNWILSGLGGLWHREHRAEPHLCGVVTVVILAFAGLTGDMSLVAKEKPPTIYQIPLPPTPDFSAIDWLLGDWTGKTTGHSAAADIRISVSYELDKQIMFLRGRASFEAAKPATAAKESWIGILVRDRVSNGYLLRLYSSKGFITQYQSAVEGPEIRINPAGGDQPPLGWLFRAIIQRTDSDEFVVAVQAAPPAKPFFDYYTVKLSRVKTQDQDKAKTAPAGPH